MRVQRAAILAAVLFFFASVGRANDPARAQALFTEGRALFAQGKLVEACAKFEESNKADPAFGTQLNLAACYEKLGKTASAWALLVALASSGSDERAKYAGERAAQLEPSLSKLTLSVPNAPAGTEVKRDGVAVSTASYGLAVPVDPGHHVIDATAPGKRFHREVDVPANAVRITVTVTF